VRVHTHTHTNNGTPSVAFGAAAGGFGVAARAPALGGSAFGAAPAVAVAASFGHPSTAQSSLQSSSTDSLVDQPTEFYHATNLKAAISIQKEGFRVDLLSKRQLLGPGIYCTTKLCKALDYLSGLDGGIIFQVRVDLGRCKTLTERDPMMTTWQQNGYDSAWHPTGAINHPCEKKEENCIKDSKRITITHAFAGCTRKLLSAGYEIVDNKIVERGTVAHTGEYAGPSEFD